MKLLVYISRSGPAIDERRDRAAATLSSDDYALVI